MEFIKEYWTNVFEPFLELYKTGYITPNPDVLCNKYIKFHYLKEYVNKKLGIQYMATGHYAQLTHHKYIMGNNNSIDYSFPVLRSGVDNSKDQSYFLSLTPVSCYYYCTYCD